MIQWPRTCHVVMVCETSCRIRIFALVESIHLLIRQISTRGEHFIRSDPTRPDPINFGFGSDRDGIETRSDWNLQTRSGCDWFGSNPTRSKYSIGFPKNKKPKLTLHTTPHTYAATHHTHTSHKLHGTQPHTQHKSQAAHFHSTHRTEQKSQAAQHIQWTHTSYIAHTHAAHSHSSLNNSLANLTHTHTLSATTSQITTHKFK